MNPQERKTSGAGQKNRSQQSTPTPRPAAGSEFEQTTAAAAAQGGQSGAQSPQRSTKAQMKEKARSVASDAAEAARDTAADATERLKQEGDQWTERQTTRAADEISHLTHAMREAASSLHEDNDHNVASAIEYAADKADHAVDYLRSCDRRRLQRDAEQFARRRPEIFYGGMFLAGLAISRFLKASSASASPGYGDGKPYGRDHQRQPSPEFATSSSWE